LVNFNNCTAYSVSDILTHSILFPRNSVYINNDQMTTYKNVHLRLLFMERAQSSCMCVRKRNCWNIGIYIFLILLSTWLATGLIVTNISNADIQRDNSIALFQKAYDAAYFFIREVWHIKWNIKDFSRPTVRGKQRPFHLHANRK